MSVLDRPKGTPSFLLGNKFQFLCSRIPTVQQYAKSINIPGITVNPTQINNPFVDLYTPGDKAQYGEMELTFLLDEEMNTWFEVHDWIRAISFPTTHEEYVKLPYIPKTNKFVIKENFPQFADAYITILSGTNQPLVRFTFIDLFPYNISDIPFGTENTPENTMTCTAIFKYSYYNVKRIGDNC